MKFTFVTKKKGCVQTKPGNFKVSFSTLVNHANTQYKKNYIDDTIAKILLVL